MKIITKAQYKKLVANAKDTQDLTNKNEPDGSHHKPVVKFFTPWGSATWLITEFHEEDDCFFGLVDLGIGTPELGYISRQELADINGPFGLGVERDRYFEPQMTISEYADKARNEGAIKA